MGMKEVMKAAVEKLKEFSLEKKHTEMGMEEVMKAAVEKLKDFLLALENLGGKALAWFDHLLPPETRGDKIKHWLHIALPYLIAAVVFAVVVRFCHYCCCRGGRVKTMKAPGRNYRMPRRAFERDPKGYFHKLRSDP